MNLQDLKGKLVAVLGYGQEGKAVAAYLMKHGVKPVLFDQRPWEKWDEIEKSEIRKLGVNFIFGPDCFKELAGFDVAFRSPGVKINDPDLLKFASITSSSNHPGSSNEPPHLKKEGKLQLTSQTKWFFEHCPAKITGVTGTKGKGTTCSLIYEILQNSFSKGVIPSFRSGQALSPTISNIQAGEGSQTKTKRDFSDAFRMTPGVYLTGNIGKVQPLDILDDLKPADWIVYELSSFQLQDLEKSPHIGVVLMVTSEHLDYHLNQQEYIAAKSAITKFQIADDFAVINADFENSIKIGELGKGKKIYFSRKKEVNEGCFVKNDEIVIAGSDFRLPPQPSDGAARRMTVPTSDLQLRGAHNLENVCAAVSVAKILNVDDKIIRSAVAGFKGLEHRLEFIGEKNGIHPVKPAKGSPPEAEFNGVKFYNDSFSTTTETAIAAINSFSEPLILILGGSTKHADFADLGRTIAESKNVKCVILIGHEADKIKRAIAEPLLASPLAKGRKTAATPSFSKEGAGGVKILEGAKNMKEIFEQIKSIAAKGDIVLLSPACASFGMFNSYVDRGNQFKEAVRNYSN